MPETPARLRGKALLRWAGLAVLAACLVYLALAVSRLDLAPLMARLGWRDWLGVAALAAAYAVSLTLLAAAWSALAAPDRKLSAAQAVAIYGPGTIAKYLPGSVFQYASRHVMGRGQGLAHGAMAHASLVEAALHVAVALALAAGLLARGGLWVPILFAGVGGALALPSTRPLVRSLALQLLFFAAFALIVVALGSLGGIADEPGRLAGYFFVAWVAGFLVPIAPGGIGVREAVLMALAGPVEGAGAAAMLALLARLVGIAGDGLFGLAGYLSGARSNTQASG